MLVPRGEISSNLKTTMVGLRRGEKPHSLTLIYHNRSCFRNSEDTLFHFFIFFQPNFVNANNQIKRESRLLYRSNQSKQKTPS